MYTVAQRRRSGSQCRVALLILDFHFRCEYFRGFAEKLFRKLFMETARPPCKTHNKHLFLILSGLNQTDQVTHPLRHSFSFAGSRSRGPSQAGQASGKSPTLTNYFLFVFLTNNTAVGVDGQTGGENTASVAWFSLRPRDAKSKHRRSCEAATPRRGRDHTPNGNTNTSINSRLLQTRHDEAHTAGSLGADFENFDSTGKIRHK